MTEEPSQQFLMTLDLPIDAIPEYGLLIVTYLDMDGVTRWALSTNGTGSLSGLLGVMEMAKFELIKHGT